MATDLRRPPASLDPGSFDGFYRRHLTEIYRYVLRDVGNRADAEEVTQAAFLDAYRALRRGHEPERPRAWMYGIARNAARRRYRTESRRPREVELAPELADSLVEEEESPELGAIRSAIARLRPSYREVVFLREVEGLSYTEIAARMQLSHSAVETLLFRARRSLRELLETEGLRPAVREGRVRSLRSVLALPALFLGKLSGRTQQLFAPELATKAAGAVTVVALSAGVAVGTQTMPGEAATKPAPAASSAAPPATTLAWLPADPRLEREVPRQSTPAKQTRERGARKQDDGGKRKPDRPEPAPAAPAAGAETGGSGGGIASGGGSGPSVSTPPVSVPAVTVPAVTTPVVSTPEVSTPAVEVPSVTVEVPLLGD